MSFVVSGTIPYMDLYRLSVIAVVSAHLSSAIGKPGFSEAQSSLPSDDVAPRRLPQSFTAIYHRLSPPLIEYGLGKSQVMLVMSGADHPFV
ncbi:hypothetical protein NXS13_08810 [Corynebacterium sp. ES2730-CONJ]|uniref:hypothetical protein n=1 Tax=Corynebacterium sp. ES2730-CONJ TaxID=2973941 RepID=UPI00216B64EB|nr:hypothetical protein [Corynebacterium sp. ES2730-CONJ]MCS4532593.1 hypothetical protein [Corynebacterium sp. ES2730-CONJ]